MPGVTLNLLQADPGTQTTISLQPDGQTMADHGAEPGHCGQPADHRSQHGHGVHAGQLSGSTTAGTAGPLLGDPTAEAVLDSVLSAISGQAGVNSSGSSGLVGISMNEDGTLSFDSNAFAQAYDANPTQVANTFISGGSSSNPLMSFYESTDATAPGAYQVDVTQAGTQATDTGTAVTGGAVTTPETLTISLGRRQRQLHDHGRRDPRRRCAGLNQAFATKSRRPRCRGRKRRPGRSPAWPTGRRRRSP